VPLAPAQDVRLTEFMASNTKTLQDETMIILIGSRLQRGSHFSQSTGLSLTDNAGNLGKWQFPSTTSPPAKAMIVFASGKNRRTPGAPLHTSFKLASGGGYLALVRPDNSIATEFSPGYPPQLSDVSYGFGHHAKRLHGPCDQRQRAGPGSGNANLGVSWLLRALMTAACKAARAA